MNPEQLREERAMLTVLRSQYLSYVHWIEGRIDEIEKSMSREE